ncbi:hypothetical protein CVIRNUC_010283 [Coccomyxa viridis]|uniref:Uncharacterized protein n=1 Tax=Coccomyxa viridis TaxID=1274662 RepID=A0AAV1IIK0_9CHLO|nr:hypothetical protein CVIRNUC_010283 [Coccomyxa viridis]
MMAGPHLYGLQPLAEHHKLPRGAITSVYLLSKTKAIGHHSSTCQAPAACCELPRFSTDGRAASQHRPPASLGNHLRR